MLIRIGYDVVFELPVPTPMLLMLNVHPSRFPSLRGPEAIRVDPYVPITPFVDAFGNSCGRIMAMAGPVRFRNDAIVYDDGLPDPAAVYAQQHPVELLPADVLQFLLASRYCEVDLLQNIAWGLFANAPTGWGRAQAICDWVHGNVTFGYQFARATRTAMEVYNERRGVCRDFTHLAITFCRCMNIPARYATGYLGDIGVPAVPSPMDFSAWFEVYLGGRWWTMDARHNQPRIGRVLMAHGRDAVDVALTTAFGVANLKQFTVVTDEVLSL
jgi:transglutaminase-like putative cysteine protease